MSQAVETTPQGRKDRSSWENVGLIVSGVALLTSCYFLLSFSVLLGWAWAVNIELLLFASLDDVWMVGILPTLFWAIVVGLPALGVWAPSKVFPAEPWLIDKDDLKRYLVYLRNTLACILFGLAFVQMWVSVYKQNTGEEIAGWMTAWLALSFPVLLCLILISHVLVTRPLRYVIPVLLFAVGIGANIWYGAKTGQIVTGKPAQFQIDLRERQPIYVTLALPPLRQGIVFLKSGICEPAKNRAGHFIPWAAIREMQPILDEVRDCHEARGGDGAPRLGGRLQGYSELIRQ